MEENAEDRRPSSMTEPSRVLVTHHTRMTVDEPDRRTIDRCRGGDREALRELFEAYGARVYSLARHFFDGDDARARDVTHDVFVKVMERIDKFEGSSRFTTWLHRLTVNACIDERRAERRLVLVSDPPEQATDATQDSAVELAETRHTIEQGLARLTPSLRAAILLRYFEDMSYDEMAEAMECAPGTVASRLSRAHAALARLLAGLRPTEGDTDA